MAEAKPKVITMPVGQAAAPEAEAEARNRPVKKVVEGRQAAIDSLPPGSGEWKVRGTLGLYVFIGAREKSYRVMKRVNGKLTRRVLTARTLAEARREAARLYQALKPRPPEAEAAPTLEEGLRRYLEEKRLRPTTAHDYGAFLHRYVADWLPRRLDSIGMDRPGYRARLVRVERENGGASAAYLHRVIRAIYNHFAKIYPDMPPNPTVVYSPPRIKPRDWALSDAELVEWWARVRELDPVKRTAYLTLLFSGARVSSVLNLRWEDVDFEKRILHFRVVKGDRPYSIPLPQKLAGILLEYREKYWLPNEENLVFPSPRKKNAPLHLQLKTPGIKPPHALRHSMRTRLAEAGCTPDLSRVGLGHTLGQNISERYITASLLTEAVRPFMEAVAARYCAVMGLEGTCAGEK
jgi:integrase